MTSNPFCTRLVRPGAIPYRFEGGRRPGNATSREDRSAQLIDELVAARFGLLVGPHGTGKSTLLRTLMPGLQHRFRQVEVITLHAPLTATGTVRLRHRLSVTNMVLRACRAVEPAGLLIVDGIEQLGFAGSLGLQYIAGRSRHLLGTSHRSLPGWATLWRTELTPDLVRALTEERLADAEPSVAAAVRDAIQRRRPEQLENLRDLWFDLYDVASHAHQAPPTCPFDSP